MKSSRHFFIFVVTSLIFFSAFLFVNQLNQRKVKMIKEHSANLERLMANSALELSFSDFLINEQSCSVLLNESKRIIKESDLISEEIEIYSASDKVIESDLFFKLKEDHTLKLLKNWIYLERIKRVCNESLVTILYFHNSSCRLCPWEGFYLNYYKKREPEKIMIFAIDTSIEVPILNTIIKNRNITKVPALVVNNNEVHEGYLDYTSIKNILCREIEDLIFCLMDMKPDITIQTA